MQIENFIDRVRTAEIQNRRDVVLSITDAKNLRDEITKLLVSKIQNAADAPVNVAPTITVGQTARGENW